MTMILAHALPDRSAGFVMADWRVTSMDRRRFADCGGKVHATPLGWIAGTTSNPAPLAATYDALRRARTMALNGVLMPTRSRRFLLECIVGLELLGYRMPLDPDPDTGDAAAVQHATTVALEACEEGVSLFVLDAARGRTAFDYGNIPADAGAEDEARIGRAFLDAMDASPLDVEARIAAAAAVFAQTESRLKSDAVSVGYLRFTPARDGQPSQLRKNFLEGTAAEIAATAPTELLDRFRAAPPTMTASEMLDAGLAQWTPFDARENA